MVEANCVRPRAFKERPYGFYRRWVEIVGAGLPDGPLSITLRVHLIHRRSAVPLPLEGKACRGERGFVGAGGCRHPPLRYYNEVGEGL